MIRLCRCDDGAMPIGPSVLAEALARIRPALPGAAPDGWSPSVQGAVGLVTGWRASIAALDGRLAGV